jgi:hypothetical protein
MPKFGSPYRDRPEQMGQHDIYESSMIVLILIWHKWANPFFNKHFPKG